MLCVKYLVMVSTGGLSPSLKQLEWRLHVSRGKKIAIVTLSLRGNLLAVWVGEIQDSLDPSFKFKKLFSCALLHESCALVV